MFLCMETFQDSPFREEVDSYSMLQNEKNDPTLDVERMQSR